MGNNISFIQPRDAWDKLSIPEKAEMMKVAVSHGIYNLNDIRQKYNEFAEGGNKEGELNTNTYSVGNLVDAIYQSNPREEYLGEPSHHYDFTQSEEWADAQGYYPNARGHRDDRVKKPAHPSHLSRGTWNNDIFALTDIGMENPNYTMFGLTDGGQDPQAVLTYKGGVVLPEVTVTPKGNYFYNPYDNIKLHIKSEGDPLFNNLNSSTYGNTFDSGGLFGNETVDTVASFLPIVGTVEDAYQFYKDPSWANAGWLALSLGSDIFTGGMVTRSIKALRIANKAHDAAQVANRAARRTWEAGKAANTAQSGSVKGADMRRMINSVGAAGATRQAAIKRANNALFEAGVATGVDQGLNGFINAAQMDLLPDFGLSYEQKHSLGGNLFEDGGDSNPMNYDYRGTIFDDELKGQGITHVAELPEITVTGRDRTKPYRSAFDGSVQPYIEYFGALSHGLQPLSLSQHVGAAADAIQGKRNYFDSLFNGNSGFFSAKYAAEHPWISTLGNMAGDITLPLATMYGTKSLINAVKTTPKLAMQEESLIKDLFAGISDYGKTTGVKAMSIADRKKGYQKMIDFISSPEYQSRLENAGLGDYKDYMINLIEKRLNGKNNFPAWRADVIKGRKNIRGLSEVDPFDIDYGVTVRSDLQGDDFLRTFDHELAHWSTKNTFPNFFYDVYQSFINRTLPNIKLQKLMKANDRVAPTKTWKDYRMEQTEGMSKEEIKRYKELFRDLKKRFKYVSDPQERRARAYSMLQEAKRRNISTDELVDMYTIDGHIYGEAPDQLFDLGMSYTPENLKKYLKGFMGIATPFALTTNLIKNEQEQ